jgi:hypothetical protein
MLGGRHGVCGSVLRNVCWSEIAARTFHADFETGRICFSIVWKGWRPARTRWCQMRHAGELDRATRLRAAADDLLRGGELLVAHMAHLSRDDIVAKAEKSERAVADAIAS